MRTKAEQEDIAEQLGKAQMTLPELQILLQLDDIPAACLQAYERGRLLGKLDVQTSIYEMAKQGTAPAQKQYMDLAATAGQYTVEDGAE